MMKRGKKFKNIPLNKGAVGASADVLYTEYSQMATWVPLLFYTK